MKVNGTLLTAQKYEALDEAGSLSRIRSGITCTGSSTRCNPLISLLCAARPASQVVPICPPLAQGGFGRLQMRDSAPRLREPGCACRYSKEIRLWLKIQQNMTQLPPGSSTSSRSSFAYSIDLDSTTRLAAPADLVDGCHKQLSQI